MAQRVVARGWPRVLLGLIGLGLISLNLGGYSGASTNAKSSDGWAVASSYHGVTYALVKKITVAGVSFTAVEFPKNTVGWAYHAVAGDPPGARYTPGSWGAINNFELRLGVVGAFNGGFKQAAGAGGVSIDGRVIATMRPVGAEATIARSGGLGISLGAVGPEGTIAQVQNLPALVVDGAPSALARGAWYNWGGVIDNRPGEPRSAIGVDKSGDVIYVGTASLSMPVELAIAMVRAGAWRAMALDMNPAWVSLGIAGAPLHRRTAFSVGLAGQWHNPNSDLFSPTRSFFVAVAKPVRGSICYGSAGVIRETTTACK